MIRMLLVLTGLALGVVPLAATQETKGTAVIQFESALLSSPGLVSRMTGGVGIAFGGRLGAEGSPFTLAVEVLHHAFRRYNTEEYAAGVHTDVTLQAEYALTEGGLYHSQVLALLGLGGEVRTPYRGAPEMLGGVAFRYELTETVAFRGSIQDRVTFIPRQEFTCTPSESCYPGYVIGRDTRHTPSALVSLELRL
jgi:hypothetical protein